MSAWIAVCDDGLAAGHLADADPRRIASREVDDLVGTRRSCRITSADCIARNALSVRSPGSPGPAPTSTTVPCSLPVRRTELPLELALGPFRSSGAHVRRNTTAHTAS